MRQKKLIISFLLIVMLHLGGCRQDTPVLLTDEEEAILSESDAEQAAKEHESQQAPDDICVYVCGAVNQSGVYTLPEGSRVYEAIAAAGGLSEEADEQYVNQAQLLSDGMQITVPVKAEGLEVTGQGGMTADGKINLNHATVQELQTLNGIGEVKAAAIVAYRESNGYFSCIEEIVNVDGISEKLYDKIKAHIVV